MADLYELPIGFSAKLGQNSSAFRNFCSLNESAQQQVIGKSRTVQSKAEMEQIIQDLASNSFS